MIETMTEIKKTKRFKTAQSYPWLSSFFALLLITYLAGLALKSDYAEIAPLFEVLSADYSFVLTSRFLISMICIFALLLAWDIQRFKRKRKQVKINTDKLRLEIEDLWESKKHLNNKAHTYSGHADKLKLFISDKLLEYIEYDEKFLHFKSIAAEVRHNGVISYDIVSSLLQKIIKDESNDEQADKAYTDKARVNKTLISREIAQQGLDSMRYLWDLLDLSTADNIALHIANQLINAEEHHYQIMLEKDRSEPDEELTSIIKADFSCQSSIYATLQHLVHEPSSIPSMDDNDYKPGSGLLWKFQDDQFNIQVMTQQALLGNSNHVRLILENLLKNAQHFSRKVPFKQKTDRILLTLTESSESEFVDFQVYNRGPLILEDNRQKLFQLGYSTRKTKEHHGKGLGLFFVNEIVKGYEGLLTLDNVQNQSDSYSIRIALKGGSVETNIVNVEVVDQRAVIIGDQGTSIRWQYSEAIESVEISSNSMQKTARFISMENDSSEGDSAESDRTEDRSAGSEKIGVYKKSESYLQSQQLVNNQLTPPCWSLDIQPKRGGNKTHNVTFNILDITGVRFSIKLPTAQARVEGIEPSWNKPGD